MPTAEATSSARDLHLYHDSVQRLCVALMNLNEWERSRWGLDTSSGVSARLECTKEMLSILLERYQVAASINVTILSADRLPIRAFKSPNLSWWNLCGANVSYHAAVVDLACAVVVSILSGEIDFLPDARLTVDGDLPDASLLQSLKPGDLASIAWLADLEIDWDWVQAAMLGEIRNAILSVGSVADRTDASHDETNSPVGRKWDWRNLATIGCELIPDFLSSRNLTKDEVDIVCNEYDYRRPELLTPEDKKNWPDIRLTITARRTVINRARDVGRSKRDNG
ncbi:MAG: hypothetical protein KDA59_25565, partial [Planctomycetales bacterium]|nr:hypothetical protein [Planctomycetales bacterium]